MHMNSIDLPITILQKVLPILYSRSYLNLRTHLLGPLFKQIYICNLENVALYEKHGLVLPSRKTTSNPFTH